MPHFPWSEDVWQPSAASRRATAAGAAYAVRIDIAPADVADRAWQQLSEELPAHGSTLADGGVALVRSGAARVEAVSGGEDVLDSLSWSINHTLRDAVLGADRAATLTVVDEGTP